MAGIKSVALRSGVSKENVQSVFDAMAVMFEEGQTIRIPDFGTFTPVVIEPRTVTSPVLPEGEVMTPRRRTLRLKLAQALKDEWVLGGNP